MAQAETIVGILLQVKDQASDAITKVQGVFGSMADKAKEAGEKIFFITEGFAKVKDAIASFFGPSLSFNEAVTRGAIAMGIEGDAVNDLSAQIKELSASHLDGLYTSTQVANAFQKIAAEGFDVETSMNIVSSAMDLAAATGTDLAVTTDQLENIMSSWNLTAQDSGKISDILLNTYRQTGTSVDQLAASVVPMGALMGKLGMSFQEATALIGVFKDVGIENTNALLMGFNALSDAASPVSKRMEELGLSAFDAGGKMKSPLMVLQELSKAGLSADETLQLFGVRGSSAMVAAMENIGRVTTVADNSVKNFGTTTKAGEQFANSSAGGMKKFQSSVDGLKESLGTGLLPVLQNLLDTLTPLLNLLRAHPEIIYTVIAAYGVYRAMLLASTIAHAAATLGINASSVAHAGHTIALTASSIASGIATAATWAFNAALYANPIVWIIALIVGLILLIIALATNFGGCRDALVGGFNEMGKKAGEFGDWAGKGLGDAGKALSKSAGDFNKWAGDGIASIGKFMGDIGGKLSSWWNDQNEQGKKNLEQFKRTQDAIMNGIQNGIKGAFDGIGNFFGDLWKKMSEWGEKAVKAFRDGMDKGKKWIEDGCKGIGDAIGNFFKGHSPPIEGPLKDIDKWGAGLSGTLMDGMGEGLNMSAPAFEKRLDRMVRGSLDKTISVAVRQTAVPGTNVPVAASQGGSKTVTVSPTFNLSNYGPSDEDRIVRRVLEALDRALEAT